MHGAICGFLLVGPEIMPVGARSETLEWYWLLGQVSHGAVVWDKLAIAVNGIAHRAAMNLCGSRRVAAEGPSAPVSYLLPVAGGEFRQRSAKIP